VQVIFGQCRVAQLRDHAPDLDGRSAVVDTVLQDLQQFVGPELGPHLSDTNQVYVVPERKSPLSLQLQEDGEAGPEDTGERALKRRVLWRVALPHHLGLQSEPDALSAVDDSAVGKGKGKAQEKGKGRAQRLAAAAVTAVDLGLRPWEDPLTTALGTPNTEADWNRLLSAVREQRVERLGIECDRLFPDHADLIGEMGVDTSAVEALVRLSRLGPEGWEAGQDVIGQLAASSEAGQLANPSHWLQSTARDRFNRLDKERERHQRRLSEERRLADEQAWQERWPLGRLPPGGWSGWGHRG
jgi:hypothetical protein